MRKSLTVVFCATGLVLAGMEPIANAQRAGQDEIPRGERQNNRPDRSGFDRSGPSGGPGGMLKMLPMMKALDTDQDGELSTEEIENAVAALKTLDKNDDGSLNAAELMPELRKMRGRGGPQPGRPRGGENAGNGTDRQQMMDRLMQFDSNDDGKLAKDEVNERLQNLIDRADTDQDGFASKNELIKAIESRAGKRGGRPGSKRNGARKKGGKDGGKDGPIRRPANDDPDGDVNAQ